MGDFYGATVVLVAGVGVGLSLHGMMSFDSDLLTALVVAPALLAGAAYVDRYGRRRVCLECGADVRPDWEAPGDRIALKRIAYAIGIGAMLYGLVFGRLFL
jgi:hypothetical protein